MIKAYLKSRWLLFFVLVWGIVIFTVIDAVTVKEESHIIYGIFLYLFVCLLAIGADLFLCRFKLQKLETIFKQLGKSDFKFDGYDDQHERLYQEMIDKLLRDTKQAIRQMSDDYNDQMEYYSMWVHQIKTPISALRLMIQSDEAIVNKSDYYAEIFRIEQYVDMVLQYLRLKNISEDTVITETDVYNVVRDSVRKFGPIFISKHLAVDIQFFDQTVYTDEKWLAFILGQFLSNSLKYSSKGTIRIYGRADENGWALIFRDEGIGIRSEDIPRIFEKGYTGYNGRIYKKSTGIGLYLAKCAADRLGLKLLVQSKQEKGTLVKVIFPKDVLCED